MLDGTQKLDGHIRDLLYDHDCVIVMGLGGFIAHYHPASINESLRFITPPSKRIAFNAALRNNDGLLAHHITYKERLTYAQACAAVAEYANLVKLELDRGGKHKIDKVGVLFNDHNGNTQFLPDTSTNFLPDSFGLPVVQAVPMAGTLEVAKTGTDPEEPVLVDFQEEDTAAQDKPIRRLRIMEMIPAAAVLALLIMAPPLIDRFNAHMGSLVPFTRIDEMVKGENVVIPAMPEIEILQPVANTDVPSKTGADSSAAPALETSNTVTEPVLTPESAKEEQVAIEQPVAIAAEAVPTPEVRESIKTSTLSFHIIVGSYKNRSNAKRMVRELRSQGIDSELIHRRDGHYLVSVFSTSSEQSAENQLPTFRSQIIASAWVFESSEKE